MVRKTGIPWYTSIASQLYLSENYLKEFGWVLLYEIPKQKLRSTILCQSDKKELEEMTMNKYGYIDVSKGRSVYSGIKNSRSGKSQYFIIPTFLRSAVSRSICQLRKEVLFEDEWNDVVENMQWKMEQFGADAFIHYKENALIGYVEKSDEALDPCEFYIMGTPVKKLKN